MGNKLKKFDLDLSLLLAIVRKECLENNICIDFSQICYVPGIIGMTMKDSNYVVYEVDEIGAVNPVLTTKNESEACLAVLNSLGIVFDQ